jgi:hypothetical protein
MPRRPIGLWDVEAPTLGCQPYEPAALYLQKDLLILIPVPSWVSAGLLHEDVWGSGGIIIIGEMGRSLSFRSLYSWLCVSHSGLQHVSPQHLPVSVYAGLFQKERYNFESLYTFIPGVEIREYGHRGPSHWLRDTVYPQKLALTSPTSGGRSVGVIFLHSKDMQSVLNCHNAAENTEFYLG